MRIISGTARGIRIEAPPGVITRPTLDRVRENAFNMLQGLTENRTVLDLFSGSGALSFEALSRGADRAVLVDRNRSAHLTQRKNAEKLRFTDRTVLMNCDWKEAMRALAGKGERFSLVFLDPPYGFLEIGDVFTKLKKLLADDAVIVFEHAADAPQLLPEGYTVWKSRNWGFCGITFYRPDTQAGPENPWSEESPS